MNNFRKTVIFLILGSIFLGMGIILVLPFLDGAKKNPTDDPGHAYVTTVNRIDSAPLTIDGCTVSAWSVDTQPNSGHHDQDYPVGFRDRVYVAHCASAQTTSASQACGKNCQTSAVSIMPMETSLDTK